MRWPPSWTTLWLLPALFIGFTVHELAHSLVAYLLGDTSQVERNRLTLNPLRHVSWLGLATFLLLGFGWAKPVQIDHSRFRLANRPFGTFLVAIAGSAANLALALVALGGMVLTMTVVVLVEGMPAMGPAYSFLTFTELRPDLQGAAVALSYYVVMVNLLLGIFNLIPLPLFDGFHAIVSLFLAVKVALSRPVPGRPPEPVAVPDAEPAGEPSPAQIHFDIGLAYHLEGQWDEAIARYRQATDYDGRFALAYYNLGLAYWAKGRLPLAVSAFRAAVEGRGSDGVRQQADRHLRHLVRVSRDPTADAGPPPLPLESAAHAAEGLEQAAVPALDPGLARAVWRRLLIGAVAGLVLALGAWLFVTSVTLLGVE